MNRQPPGPRQVRALIAAAAFASAVAWGITHFSADRLRPILEERAVPVSAESAFEVPIAEPAVPAVREAAATAAPVQPATGSSQWDALDLNYLLPPAAPGRRGRAAIITFPDSFLVSHTDARGRLQRLLDAGGAGEFSEAFRILDSLAADGASPELERLREFLLYTAGVYRLSDGDAANAALYLSDLEKLDPEPPLHEIPLGLAYYQLNATERAFEYLRNAYERNGEARGFDYELGALAYQFHDFTLARTMLRAALNGRHAQPARRLLEKVEREGRVEEDFREIFGPAAEHFHIVFDGMKNIRPAYKIGVILSNARRDIGVSLGFYPEDKVPTVIYTNVQYERALNAPEWSAALYDGKIRIPTGGLGRDADPLRDTIYHEYAHAVIHRIGGDRVPAWLHEGLAQVLEPGARRYDYRDFARSRHRRYRPTSLIRSFSRLPSDQVSSAYLSSKSFVGYLVAELGGYRRLASVLGKMSEGADVDEAFRRTYGRDLVSYERRWEESLERSRSR